MKKIVALLIVCFSTILLSGCANSMVTNFGGKKEIFLPDNMKFVNYNIQDSNIIWCTYRPMRENEEAEVYYIAQDADIKPFGEGSFIIYESKNGEVATVK